MILSFGQLLYLLTLSLIEVFVHLVVWLVPEGLKCQELAGVLHISELFQWPPMLIVVILKHEGLLVLALLREWRAYLADERTHFV